MTDMSTSGTPHVLYETREDGRIAVITMNRARYRNPLSLPMMRALDEAFARAAGDDGVYVIILQGDGPSFCSGHDTGSPDAVETRAEMDGAPFAKRIAHMREMTSNRSCGSAMSQSPPSPWFAARASMPAGCSRRRWT